jgi:N-acetylmuramoyl-L-alanine amidase
VAAKAAFEDFLQHYPHSRMADDARKAITDMDAEQAAKAAKPKGGKAPAEAGKQPAAKVVQAEERNEDRPQRRGGKLPLVTGIRFWSTPDYTRVAIDLEQEVKYEAGRVPDPDRIFFDLHDTKLASPLVGKSFDVEDGFLKKIRVAQYQIGQTRVVLEVDDVSDYSAFFLPNPYRLIIDIHGRHPDTVQAKAAPVDPSAMRRPKEKQETPAAVTAPSPALVAKMIGPSKPPSFETPQATPKQAAKTKASEKAIEKDEGEKDDIAKDDVGELKATNKPTTKPTFAAVAPREREKQIHDKATTKVHEAAPTAAGDRSLIRALGLKIGKIVVDAGHGGHDTGTIGPHGLLEKDLVLDVALRLGKLLENRMGADVVYTRDDDTFVPLETRTAIANQEQADLFISIHANSSRDASARGVETYYLNFTSSADALEVAARENAVSDKSIHELQDLVKKIALKEKIEESREFAADVQHSLYQGVGKGRDRGVKKAPFIVLIGANMPSILAEISFVSNPQDEKKLRTPEYRQKIAESLYRGVSKYVSGLSGVKVAAKGDPDKGQ